MTTMEHISRYLIQLGDASIEEAHKVRFFPLSLSGTAFSWFSSLEQNSIIGWADLENKFHAYFYSGTGEKKIIDLINMRQRSNELGSEFIQRFKEVRSRCYSLNLPDGQLAELALQGMSLILWKKFNCQEFKNLARLVQRVYTFEGQLQTMRKEKYLKGTAAMFDPYDADFNEDGLEAAATKWMWSKTPLSCPQVKETESAYNFDIKKADKIFDLLLEKKQLRLPTNHVIPLARELKGKKY